jgi:hypothetical protein
MRSTLLALSAFTVAFRLSAQTGDGHASAVQLRMLEHQRKMLLAMADSMPERLYRDKATPAQRDFAQQIHHAANSAAYIASAVLKGGAMSLPDTGTAFGSRAGLERFVNGAFDFAVKVFKGQSSAARTETVNLFGQSMPAWQVWDEIQTHTVWTAGQVVANFRKNGMAPPSFTFF